MNTMIKILYIAEGLYLRTRLNSLQGLVVLLSSYIALALVT
jgi:hypothetical protein